MQSKQKRQKLLQELGGQRIPFLSPADSGFQQLWESSYPGLVLRRADGLPPDLHGRVQAALCSLRGRGCLLRDLVRVRGRDVFTSVSRALLGLPGYTYRYLNTRLFTIPWHSEEVEERKEGEQEDKSQGEALEEAENKDKACCDQELRAACKALWELNHFFCKDVYRIEEASDHEQGPKEAEAGGGSPQAQCSKGSPVTAQFNVTLLNYMDPTTMDQLKEEPYYGMGKMAVGWHHDENLVSFSSVAVYNYSCQDDKVEGGSSEDAGRAPWRLGLKVAWDINTPGLAVPLQTGDCYYLRDDLNRTHQHCVLAGEAARFSSTHRVAECSSGTLEYIRRRCEEALENMSTNPDTGARNLHSLSPSALQLSEEIHNEVEFEWLRQYWFQGRRYSRFCSWWNKPMEELEESWREMESMTQLTLAVAEDDSCEEQRRKEVAEALLPALTERQQHRLTWKERCESRLAQTLPPEEAPINRPYWCDGDPSMPLPFDLTDIISRVESLLWNLGAGADSLCSRGSAICPPAPWRLSVSLLFLLSNVNLRSPSCPGGVRIFQNVALFHAGLLPAHSMHVVA
ncbi:alpha-ketoglutarate-dependent dioxygenase FTO isoform X2 [Paramormyrops kingsleyae]|uniref:alpha-ketoglutarate-dependent dioxygenase FTO isoform X2 n=1 Tax=Paramormyrops kingsleyae TaxID=1676925 RepID=UPI003B97085A